VIDKPRKWKAGDVFYDRRWPSRMYRVHRVKGTIIWFIGNQYGHNPPRGCLHQAHFNETFVWQSVERDYSMPRNATTMNFTHEGRRTQRRGECEKCNTPTNWMVMSNDRPAYWCGCD
jgi:hypothetical protein